MMNTTKFPRMALALAIAGAAACGSDSSTEASSTVDINAAVNQSITGDLSSYAGARSATGVPGTTTPTFDATQCPYSAGDQSFTCPTRTQNGMSYTLKYFLYDAGGQSLAQQNPAVTSSVRTVLDAIGTISAPSGQQGSISINHHSDMRLSGLLGATRTLAGTSRDRDTLVTTSGSSTVKTALDASSTTANLVLPSSTTNPYPASGTITSDITGSSSFGGFSTNSTVHSVLTFNGTNMATLAFTSGFGTTTCLIDLSGKSGAKC